MKVKSKQWLFEAKYKNVRKRIKRTTHKQERRTIKEDTKKATIEIE